MLKSVDIGSRLKAVPHLSESTLSKTLGGKAVFSTRKPNVVIGPNGSGKSALMTALALMTMSYYSGRTALDSNYVSGLEATGFWNLVGSSWERNYAFMSELKPSGGVPTAEFYRPGMLPGDDDSVAAAMMCGYWNEARRYGDLTKEKSSGEAASALLREMMDRISGADSSKMGVGRTNWKYSEEKPKRADGVFHESEYDKKALALAEYAKAMTSDSLFLMDEPEQSLDALSEARFWKAIEEADCSNRQIIIATHSLHPILRRGKFSLIEAVVGYADETVAAFGTL